MKLKLLMLSILIIHPIRAANGNVFNHTKDSPSSSTQSSARNSRLITESQSISDDTKEKRCRDCKSSLFINKSNRFVCIKCGIKNSFFKLIDKVIKASHSSPKKTRKLKTKKKTKEDTNSKSFLVFICCP